MKRTASSRTDQQKLASKGIDSLIGMVKDPDSDLTYDELRYQALKKKYNL